MGVRVPSFAQETGFSGMQTSIETLGKLERRLNMAVPAEQIDREVEQRLRKLSRTVRIDGFRPGKVPLKIVAQRYGPQVRSEVIGDAVQKAFSEVVKDQKLKVAGYPRIERKETGNKRLFLWLSPPITRARKSRARSRNSRWT